MLKSPPPQSSLHHRQHRNSQEQSPPPVIATTSSDNSTPVDCSSGKADNKADNEPLSLTAADSSSSLLNKYEEAASSCDADDEEVVEAGWGYYGKKGDVIKQAEAQDDDQPLDFSCKSSRKRSVEEGDGGGDNGVHDNKKVKWGDERPGPALKRKHLRKKRNKKGVRPSVISFAGAVSSNTSSSAGKSDNGGSLHNNNSAAESCGGGSTSISTNSGGGCSSGGGSSSSSSASSGTHQERRRLMRSKRKRMMMSAGKGFDVDEHFRRSLGGVLYEQVVVGLNGNGVVGGGLGGSSGHLASDLKREAVAVVNKGDGAGTSSVRLIIEEGDVKPSDVDDHFAKALGSETWSRIVKQGSNKQPISSITPPPPAKNLINDSSNPLIRASDNKLGIMTISCSDKKDDKVMMRQCSPLTTSTPPPPPLIIPKLPLKPNENNHRQSSFKIENLLGTSSSTKRRGSNDDGDVSSSKRVCNNGI